MSAVWCSLRPLGSRARAARKVVLLLAAIPLLASSGCGGSTNGGDGAQSNPRCHADYGDELAVSWTGPESATYVDQVVACTDSSQVATYIRNDSEAVFTLTTAIAGTPVTHLSDERRFESFRRVAEQVYGYPDAILSPGADVIVDAPPPDVTWTLDPQLSAMWIVHDTLVEKVAAYGETQVISMLSQDSPRRRALVTCAQTAFHAAQGASPMWESSQPSKQLLAALGVGAGATNCARAWQEADNVELNRGIRTATWSDDIVRLVDDTDFLVRTNSQLTKVRNFARFIFSIP